MLKSNCRASRLYFLNVVATFQTSLLFFNPNLFTTSAPSLILVPCHGCLGVLNAFLLFPGYPIISTFSTSVSYVERRRLHLSFPSIWFSVRGLYVHARGEYQYSFAFFSFD